MCDLQNFVIQDLATLCKSVSLFRGLLFWENVTTVDISLSFRFTSIENRLRVEISEFLKLPSSKAIRSGFFKMPENKKIQFFERRNPREDSIDAPGIVLYLHSIKHLAPALAKSEALSGDKKKKNESASVILLKM